jgi:hypothetical protein
MRGRTRTSQADELMARIAAERILEALRNGYKIRPKGYRNENASRLRSTREYYDAEVALDV